MTDNMDSKAAIEQGIMDKIRDQETPFVSKGAVNQAKYIAAVLNSSLGRWFLAHTETIPIPIPKISTAKQRPFIRLVDRILEAKAADPKADTSELEESIDWKVYDLYDISDEETAEVADFFWQGTLTEEEEDAAFLKMMLEAETGDFVSEETIMETLRSLDGN